MEPNQRQEIISIFARLLEGRTLSIGRESDLPWPVTELRQALQQELLAPDSTNLDLLEAAYLEIETFLSEREFELLAPLQTAIVSATELVNCGGLDSIARAADMICDPADEACQVEQRILIRQRERLAELQNFRLARGGELTQR
ncbi:MAG TPA: hypothetical protein VFR01_07450 [Geobacterales bacterium]|nr:hypothetical protein [Geobacterales bacterium]